MPINKSIAFGIILFIIVCYSSNTTQEVVPSNEASPTNISGSFWNYTAYNDPCVIKMNNYYYMYLSRNTDNIYLDGRTEPVSMFMASSTNRVNWIVKSEEILKLGDRNDWDYNKVETPSVIFFNNTFHMYYSGGSQYSIPVSYKIGHATSSDGINWIKDNVNPIITSSQIPDSSLVLHVAEPGALVYKEKVYLYFVVTKQPTDRSYPEASMDIYLAISEDGYTFNTPQKILSQSGKYLPDHGYIGYSTPSAVENNGKIYLYYDVFYQTNNNISKYEQIILQTAESSDGVVFIEAENAIMNRNSNGWTKREIRGGNVIIEDGTVHMWFSGDNYEFTNGIWKGKMTVGYAHWKLLY